MTGDRNQQFVAELIEDAKVVLVVILCTLES